MYASSNHRQINRISNRSEIVSVLENVSLKIQSNYAILIGSRAAQHWLPNFRRSSNENNTDWDIICSSHFLLDWLHKKDTEVKTIDMIIPISNDNDLLDLYVYGTLDSDFNYDFSIPRSSESYTAYLLNNWEDWTSETFEGGWWNKRKSSLQNGSAKLLLILKKFMLYYSHQWVKTATDYRQLLTVADPLTENDRILCDLFVQYNEKVHGNRPDNTDRYVISPSSTHKGIIIKRDEFFTQNKDQQLALIYHTAMSMAISDDILIGLEKICTQGPLWLADFVINNWLPIHHEKFKQKINPPKPLIEFQIDNYRFFSEIPELVQQRILHNITDTSNFYSMKLVCKRWYAIIRQDLFWRDLYVSCYGKISARIDDVRSWRIMYFTRLEENIYDNQEEFQKLVDASLQLRQTKAEDIVQLWEDLTREDQPVKPDMFSKLNYILSNSFYIQMKETSDEYLVKLIIIGLDEVHSRVSADLKLHIGEYGSSRYTDYMEELSIELIATDNTRRSLKFFGPSLFGFYLGKWGYFPRKSTLLTQTPSILYPQFPSGLLVCLLIMLTHPAHRGQFIKYLKRLESHCARVYSTTDY
ncbi:unnamed protein product [Rotaria sp. Silwood1]|nr:unnamed protein product [Rotaria sp. Silwood1]